MGGSSGPLQGACKQAWAPGIVQHAHICMAQEREVAAVGSRLSLGRADVLPGNPLWGLWRR